MSAHVLLNLLNEFGKRYGTRLCRASYRFSPMSLIISIIEEQACKFLFIIIHMTLKSHFISEFCNKTSQFRH